MDVKVAVGAPVFNRGWILSKWWEYMAKQTLRPDYFCFVHGRSTDDTLDKLYGGGQRDPAVLKWGPAVPVPVNPAGLPVLKLRASRLPVFTRDQRNDDPKDRCRARHMAALRNELRALFMSTDADVFVSLDTDILLTDPMALERMVAAVTTGAGVIRADTSRDDWDVAAAMTSLHPYGFRGACFNAARWAGGEPGSYTRGWHRLERNDIWTSRPMPIDVPMAAYAIKRHAMGMAAYREHECGEDFGFADRLEAHGLRTIWLTDVQVPHVWGPQYIEEAIAEVAEMDRIRTASPSVALDQAVLLGDRQSLMAAEGSER